MHFPHALSAGLKCLKGLKSMSNSRSKSQYLPMIAYVAARQTADAGDLWAYSTRATESRVGRYKRLKKTTCQRPRAIGDVFRSVRNKKLGIIQFKKQRYNSSTSFQLLRGGCAQEANAHRLTGRSRIKTTGRKTLKRTAPKWEEDKHPMPPLGRLLDPEALKCMLSKAGAFFTAHASELPSKVPLRMIRLVAGS